MFRLNDIILLLVIYVSILLGVLLPRLGSLFQPYLLYFMMYVFFSSFLPIKTDTIWHTLTGSVWTIVFLAFLKTIALPITIYFLFRATYPPYAISAMLLSGISTGIVGLFISNLVNANTSLVLVMVVITSMLVPFTLPALVKIILARSIDISLYGMIRMLSLVIFVPILAVETLRHLKPGLINGIMKRQFPVLLVVLSLVMQGAFSQYAQFFYQNPSTILMAMLVGVILSGIYFSVGILSFLKGSIRNQLAAVISLGNINNVLTIVFASQFFGPLEATVAALYMLPFFGLILPLRIYRTWRQNQKCGKN